MTNVRLLCFLLALGLNPSADAKPQLTVAAAISLKPLLEDALTAYLSQHQVSVDVTYGASGVLSRQIRRGAPIDLFLSGAPEHVDAVEQDHLLVPGSRLEFARGSLVLVTPKGKNFIKRFEDLAGPQVKRLAIGDPKTVPAGSYAMEILASLRLSPGIDAKLIPTVHARQALAYVERGDVDAGIVYRSDALSSPKLHIAAEADPSMYRPVRYEAVIINRSREQTSAESLLHFLSGTVVKTALARHGLNPPGGKS